MEKRTTLVQALLSTSFQRTTESCCYHLVNTSSKGAGGSQNSSCKDRPPWIKVGVNNQNGSPTLRLGDESFLTWKKLDCRECPSQMFTQANLRFTPAHHMKVSSTWRGKHDFSTVNFPPFLIIFMISTQFFIYPSLSIAVSPFAEFMDWAALHTDWVRHIFTIRKQLNGHGSAVGMLV